MVVSEVDYKHTLKKVSHNRKIPWLEVLLKERICVQVFQPGMESR